jgi:ABC-type uncharacterized transport system substrate-binding protein
MKKKITVLTLYVLLLALCFPVEAQLPKKIPLVGFIVPGSPSSYAARIEAFQQSLRDHGYIEGKNINIECRYAEGKFDRVPDLAAELVRLKVDMIVTGDTPAIQGQENHHYDPDCHGERSGCHRRRTRRQPGAARR